MEFSFYRRRRGEKTRSFNPENRNVAMDKSGKKGDAHFSLTKDRKNFGNI